jgi:pilus assembly protein CpaB
MMVLMLAVVSGISAVIGVRRMAPNNAQPPVETVRVVVAALDLPPGNEILKTSLKTREFPKNAAPANVISDPDQIAGRVAVVPIAPDDLVLESKLAPRGVTPGITSLIPLGMRAVSIPIANVAAGHSGLLMPKNRVDVLFTSTDQGVQDQTGGGSTSMLLQNVEILAVDRRIYVSGETKSETSEIRSVTLLVTPDQANKIDLASNRGLLHLALRNPKDDKPADTKPALLADLRFHQETMMTTPSPADPAPEPVRSQPIETLKIRSLRGRSAGWIAFPSP